MKEINLKKDLRDTFDIIAERYQRISQYKNTGAQLLHKGRAVIYVEDTGMGKIEYLLDKEEREDAIKTPDIFLDDMIHRWTNTEDDCILAMYQWFPETIDHNYQEGHPCRVLIVGCFFGYEPINWAKTDEGEEIVFSSPALAKAYIEEQEKGPYILKHGEADRPEYFIISA